MCEGENRCIDTWTDPAHCGYCGNACGAGNVCVDKTCGPASGVAPFITGLSPGSGPKGGSAPVTVQLNGQRFAQGATVRSVTPAGTHTYETTWVSASSLHVDLDLSASPATISYLRVVNPDKVISNPVRFEITTPTPAITGLSPAGAVTGQVTQFTVAGTGFLAESECHYSGQGNAQALLTVVNGDGTLTCTFDATSLPPATGFQLWVENPALPTSVASQPRSFNVISATPVVNSVSPSQAASNEAVAFTVDGDGFDVTSQVLFDGTPLTATTFVSARQLYIPQYLPAACSSGTCPHVVRVRNGTAGTPSETSATFYVGAQPPQITGLSPGSAYQGATDVVLTFTGSGFPTGTQLQLQPPGGAFGTPISATVNGTGTQVTAVVPSFVDSPVGTAPEGTWLVRLVYPGPINSASYPFRLLSNLATLVSSNVRGEMQGKQVTVTLSAVNLRPSAAATVDRDIRVVFAGQDRTPSAVNITQASSGTGTVTVQLSTVDLDTGTYTVQVRNPSAQPSNALSFNVTPGQPTVVTVTPSSAVQSDTPTLIVLTGTNFAKPDASGNGGSIVHVASTALGILDFALPASATTVVNSKRLEVRFDTRTGVPGTYDVSVWNPGGPTPPQKSNSLTGAFTIQ
ncbi:MAG: IPT/TIG domain-containing protein [Anaeromyxobacter sp.]